MSAHAQAAGAGAAATSGGHEGRRRALAPHLRRHDHAAHGAVHRHVGDLVGEHDEVRRAVGVAQAGVQREARRRRREHPGRRASLMPRSRARRRRAGQADRDRPDLGRAAVAERSTDHRRPERARRRRDRGRRGRRPREPRSASSSGSTRGRRSTALKKKVATHDRRARPRRAACSPTTCSSTAARPCSSRRAQPLLAADRRRSSRDAARRRTRSASRATPTTSRSRTPRSAPTGSCPPRARPPCSRACCTHGVAASRAVRDRLRGPAAARHERLGRRPIDQPPRRARRPASRRLRPGRSHPVKKKILIIVPVLLLVVGGGLQDGARAQAGGAEEEDRGRRRAAAAGVPAEPGRAAATRRSRSRS